MELIKMTHDEMVNCVITNANLFYNGHPTEINDAEYDAMLCMIKEDDPNFDIYSHIKYENDGVELYHSCEFRDFYKTADIANILTEKDFQNMMEEYDILPKFDGSSTVTYYKPILKEDGSLDHTELDKILSRHDDNTGFLNTNKLRNKVKDSWDATTGVIVQLSEAVCPKYAEDGTPLGRGKANGLINSKYNQGDVDNLLTLIPFDYHMYDGSKVPNLEVAVTDYEVFCRIRDKGEWVDPKTGILYPCDGIVGYPKDRSNQQLRIIKLYFSESKETTVLDIEWTPAGNSGVFHPVAVFDTVELEDTCVSRATINNYEFAKSISIYPGCRIKVAKANMTIPQILEVVEPDLDKAKEYYDNLRCPICGEPLQSYGRVDCVCSNPGCSWWVTFMANKIAYGLLGGENVDQMVWEYLYGDTPDGNIKACKLLFTPEILKKFEDPEFMINFIGIPRLNENKWYTMLTLMKGGDEANQIVEWKGALNDPDSKKNWDDHGGRFDIIYAGWWSLSDMQYGYLEMFMSHFNYVMEKIKE